MQIENEKNCFKEKYEQVAIELEELKERFEAFEADALEVKPSDKSGEEEKMEVVENEEVKKISAEHVNNELKEAKDKNVALATLRHVGGPKVNEILKAQEEFEKIRNQFENQIVTSNSSIEGICENLANNYVYFGNANRVNNLLESYMKVTREDIQRVAVQYLTQDARVILHYLPKKTN